MILGSKMTSDVEQATTIASWMRLLVKPEDTMHLSAFKNCKPKPQSKFIIVFHEGKDIRITESYCHCIYQALKFHLNNSNIADKIKMSMKRTNDCMRQTMVRFGCDSREELLECLNSYNFIELYEEKFGIKN